MPIENYTYSSEGPQCPYCLRQYTADESWWYEEDNFKDFVCDECEKPLRVEVEHDTHWTVYPIEEKVDTIKIIFPIKTINETIKKDLLGEPH